MKFLFMTDTHVTAKNPASRIDDIQETILNKFNEIADIIKDERVDVVLHGGDMCHTPDVSNKFTGEVAKVFKSFGVPIFVVPGNHDLFGYNSSTLSQTKLGLLQSTGVLNIVDRANPVVFNDGNIKIGLEGQEYHSKIDENVMEDFKITNLKVDYNILLYHGMLLDHKFIDGIKHTLIKDVITSADLVLAGHFHPGFKPVEKDGVKFYNPGSLLRVDASVASTKYMPSVLIIDVKAADNVDIKTVELKSAKKSDEVFSTTVKANRLYNNSLESFHKKIKETKLKGVSINDLIDEYSKENQQDDSIVTAAKNMISMVDAEKSCDNGYISERGTIHITKVEINNFQRHTKKTVEFVDGLNVIQGESNTGKTAILRAIYWVLYNKPNGDDFIKTGAKSAKVRVHFSNGTIIERKRSRSSAGSYIISKPGEEDVEYKGFANNIPVEVSNAHQMPEVKIGGSNIKINVASQHDLPFMIGNGPGERIALLGALVDTDRADMARKEFLAEKKRATTEMKQLDVLLEEKVAELNKYADIDRVSKMIKILEAAFVQLDSYEVKLKTIERQSVDYNNRIQDANDIVRRLKKVDLNCPDPQVLAVYEELLSKCEKMYSEFSKYRISYSNSIKCDKILSGIPNIRSLNEQFEELKNSLNKLVKLEKLDAKHKELSELTYEFNHDVELYKKITSGYSEKLEMLEKAKTLYASYMVSVKSESALEKNKENLDNSTEESKKEYDEIYDKLSKMENLCPTCGSSIDLDTALNIEIQEGLA